MTTQKWLVAAVLSLCVASPSLVSAQVPEDKPLPIIHAASNPQYLLRFKNPVEYQDTVKLLKGVGFSSASIARATGTLDANGKVYNTLDLGLFPTLSIQGTGATLTFSFTETTQIKSFSTWARTVSHADAMRLNQAFRIHLKTASGATQLVVFGGDPSEWTDDECERITIATTLKP